MLASRARRADQQRLAPPLRSPHLHAYWHCPRPHRPCQLDAFRAELPATEQSLGGACDDETARRFLPYESSPHRCHSPCLVALALGSSLADLSDSTWLVTWETN